jgi:hypothetical protein
MRTFIDGSLLLEPAKIPAPTQRAFGVLGCVRGDSEEASLKQ